MAPSRVRRAPGIGSGKDLHEITEEVGDVLGMCLVYAGQMGIDPVEAVTGKWFKYEKTADGAAAGV